MLPAMNQFLVLVAGDHVRAYLIKIMVMICSLVRCVIFYLYFSDFMINCHMSRRLDFILKNQENNRDFTNGSTYGETGSMVTKAQILPGRLRLNIMVLLCKPSVCY